jgi:hypothetical protein
MPCYCEDRNTHDEKQRDLARLAKIRMICTITTLLNNDRVNQALCNISESLTMEQMKSISAERDGLKWPYKTLYDWYTKHLEDDKSLNNIT